jgi:hypothetical protein
MSNEQTILDGLRDTFTSYTSNGEGHLKVGAVVSNPTALSHDVVSPVIVKGASSSTDAKKAIVTGKP